MEGNAEAQILDMWNQQARKEPPIAIDDIQAKAARLDAKRRKTRWMTTLLIALVTAWEVRQVWIGQELLERAGDLLTIAAFVYIGFRYRRHRMPPAPAALGRTSSADFYRAELIRRRDLAADGWGFLLPFVPGVGLALLSGAGNRSTGQVIALVAFGVALFLGVACWNAYTVRRVQREIDGLLS